MKYRIIMKARREHEEDTIVGTTDAPLSWWELDREQHQDKGMNAQYSALEASQSGVLTARRTLPDSAPDVFEFHPMNPPTLDREKLRRDARDTVRVLQDGGYAGPQGHVDLTADLTRLAHATRLFLPEELADLTAQWGPGQLHTRISVTRETTLQAAQRLLGEGTGKVAVLNFASATSPGGGFLTGSAAQEESLARASALYTSLMAHPEYYEFHQALRSPLYSDRMMFASDVPVFRDEGGGWLPQPYQLDILTAAAPNLRGVDAAELVALKPEAERAIERRVEGLLSIFRAVGCTRLVLGAWGCGAFRNDPEHVARAFHHHLTEGRHQGAFEEVVFAVFTMPWEETNLRAFQRQFDR